MQANLISNVATHTVEQGKSKNSASAQVWPPSVLTAISFGILIVGRHDSRPDFCQAQLFLYAKSTAG